MSDGEHELDLIVEKRFSNNVMKFHAVCLCGWTSDETPTQGEAEDLLKAHIADAV